MSWHRSVVSTFKCGSNYCSCWSFFSLQGKQLVITPMMVFQGGSCVKTTCRLPLSSCPTNENNGLGNLQVNRNGNLVACLSPCKRWNYPPPYGMNRPESNSPGKEMCCPSPMTPQTCSSGPVVSTQYVKLVRSQCPSAYSYAYDDLAALVKFCF